MKNKILFFTILLSFWRIFPPLNAQQTVGTFQNDSLAMNGYTLVNTASTTSTHIIDNCGMEINSWQSEYLAGLVAYLTEDGYLYRAGSVGNHYNRGGAGGIIEKFNWEGERIWHYLYSDEEHRQHHDFEVMPNGNILILAWEGVSREEGIALGRVPDFVPEFGLWMEHIIEVKPIGPDSGIIVWEWHIQDHLIQNINEEQENYGIIEENPGKFDINYDLSLTSDWIHFNSIDYNEELDQIMLNSRNFSEFFIIDHSTTSEEAMSSRGGRHDKGGNFIYRWGNPMNYNRGTAEDQILFGAHDAAWIDPGLPDAGKITLFNNGVNRPGGFSEIFMLTPPINDSGGYILEANEAFGPEELDFKYDGLPDNSFFSNTMSGVSRLENGNFLVTDANRGKGFEVDTLGNIHWLYINPLTRLGATSQGEFVIGNNIFRYYKYPPSYGAFDGRDLTPIAPLEENYIDYGCRLFPELTTSIENPKESDSFTIAYNSANRQVNIHNKLLAAIDVSILSPNAQLLRMTASNEEFVQIELNSVPSGYYVIQIKDKTKAAMFSSLVLIP